MDCSSPAAGNGLVYVDYNTVEAFATSGKTQWKFKPGALASASPALANGVLYVATDDGNLYGLDASTGAQLWHTQIAAHLSHSSPAVVNGILYIGSGSKQMFAFALP